MSRAARLIVILALGAICLNAPVFAQTAPDAAAGTDFLTGEISVQGAGRPDVESSRFEEYRDVVKGVSLPSFRLFGSDGGVRFDLRGENVKQRDERYTGYLKTDFLALMADFNSIVHRIGNAGRTMLNQQSPGVWRISDSLQQALQNSWESTTNANRVFTTFVAPLFTPSIAEGNTVDVQVMRERTDIVMDLARNQPFTMKMNYRREQRHGSGGLSSNYLTYVIETPSVTEYLTQDVGFNGALDRPWGNVRGGFHYNWYIDQVPSLVFDSPFRATDALAVTAGTGTAATAVGGPASGRMINPPDNSAYLTAIGTTLKMRHNTRVTADVNLGRLSQNEPFFPYLTNTAVVTPLLAAQTSSLPAQSLNGKIQTTSVVLAVTSRPVEPLHLALRYRRYDLNNKTSRITFPGMGSWDRSWSAGERITAPYGYTNGRLDASADYDIGPLVTLEGAYRRATVDRTFRETEQTVENAVSVALITHVADRANLRAMYEKGRRGYNGLELGRSEDATFVTAPTGLPSNQLENPGNLRFDQAKRDSDRAGIVFDVSPASMTTVAFTYFHNKDEYNETAHGLQEASYDTYTGEISVSPGEQWNASAYYSREKNGNTQINNGTSGFPTINDFTIRLQDTVDTAGASALFQIVPSKATLNLGGRYQNLKGTAGFTTQPGSAHELARASLGGVQDIPNADNTKILRLDASVDYAIRPKVTLTVGTWYEDYVFSDVDSVGLQNLYPGAFFLALNDGTYNATVGYVRLTYHW